MQAGQSLRDYALECVSLRLETLAAEVRRTAETPDAESVHDLRVAIRRFMQGLTVFGPALPAQPVRKISRRLRKTMRLTGAIRDRDIALEFLQAAGLKKKDSLRRCLREERRRAEKELIEKVRRWDRRLISQRWRAELCLATHEEDSHEL